MGRIHSKGGLFLVMIFFVSFDSSKSKSVVPEGKIEINGRLLETGKLQYTSHPEVEKWQSVLRERRKNRKLKEKENNITTKIQIGTHGYETGREEVNTHPPPLTENKNRVKCLPVLATLIPHITKFTGGSFYAYLGN